MTDAQVEFNTFSPNLAADPYPTYAQLRNLGRLLWMPAFGNGVRIEPPGEEVPGVYMVTHYDDCMALLRDERLSSDPARSQVFNMVIKARLGRSSPAMHLMRNLLIFMDPPDHTRLRALANAAFSWKAVEELRGRIARIVDELLAAPKTHGEMDLVADFAYPLPVIVIAEMLGVPVADRERLRKWPRELVELFGTSELSTESTARGNAAIEALNEYFTELGEERRRNPKDDLLTALVEVEDQGERLSHDEYLATCLILLIAGYETTANLIALGTLALLRNPEALQHLRDDPSLIPRAIDELLRYDSPVQFNVRTTLASIEVGDRTIPARQPVLILYGSANRDPSHFTNPDQLVFDRSPNSHLSFSGGIHFCMGAPLALLEARIAFAELVKLPLRLATPSLEWRNTLPVRGLRTLPLVL